MKILYRLNFHFVFTFGNSKVREIELNGITNNLCLLISTIVVSLFVWIASIGILSALSSIK